jgi:hypothetical protein
MSILQSIMASISTPQGGGGGGGGGGGPSYGSWTIEFWEKKLSPQSGNPRIFAVGVDGGASIGYSQESGGDYVWTNGATGPFAMGSIVNSWHHVSINSDGTNLYVFKDGQQLTATARTGNPVTDATTPFYLGGDTNFHWKGRITDLHIMKGGVKYIQPGYYPNGRTSAVTETVLLYPFNDGNWNPNTGPNVDQVGSVVFSTDDPWGDGGGSVEFNGTTASFLKWAGSSIFALDVA